MRKTIFASAFILLTTFGCGKNDDSKPATIVGKWTATTAEYKEYEGTKLTQNFTQTFTDGSYYEFLADGTLNVSADGETYSTTYKYDASSKTITLEDDDQEQITVTQLTSNQLTLHEEEISTDDDGTSIKDVTDVHFKK